MKRKSEQEILSSTRPEHIFTMDLQVIELEKDEYLEQYKPREYRTIQNFMITKKVMQLYNQAMVILNGESDINVGQVTIKSIAGKEYTVNYFEHSSTKLGEMYITHEYVIYIVKSCYCSFYENYIEKTKRYLKPDKKIWKMVQYALPDVQMHFECNDGKFAIFIKKPCEMYSLREILDYFNGSLDAEYVASILTRLYYFVSYLNLVEINHNGITLDNIFFAPGKTVEEGDPYTVDDMRIVGVFGGWFFSTFFNEKIKGIPKEVRDVVPSDYLERGYSSFVVDEFSVQNLAKELLGERINKAPKAFYEWIHKKTTQKDAYEEFCAWEKVLIESFGKRRFIEMSISDY